jgi:hypothetical protein
MKVLLFFLTMATGGAFTGTIDDSTPNPFFSQNSQIIQTSTGAPEVAGTLNLGVQQTGGEAYIACVVGELSSGTSNGVRIQSQLSIVNSGQIVQSYPLSCYQDVVDGQNFSDASFMTGPFPTSVTSLAPFLTNFSTVPPIIFRVNSSPAGQFTPYTLIALPWRCRLDFNEIAINVLASNNPNGTGTGSSVICICAAVFII